MENPPTTTTRPQIKMILPTWAKVLLGVFIASLIGVIVTIAMAALGFSNVYKQMTDPNQIKVVAAKTFGISQLPDKFVYTAGATVPQALSFVTISYDNHQTDFLLHQAENSHGLTDPNLPDILQNDPFEAGIAVQKPISGEATVAGHKMAYILGDLGTSGKAKQFRGAYLSNDNKLVTRITGTTAGADYNMEATKQLLSCIK
jgi:hypothetical protein